MRTHTIPAAVGMLLLAAPLAAEQVIELDNQVVTATRTPMSVDESLARVVVITREQIRDSMALDLAELLRFHAGIDVARNGGPGQATSLFFRGTDSNHTLVLVDGVRINPGTIGGAAIQNIAPGLIERIEIVAGPRSSLYGSDAIGGVINVITRSARRGAPGTEFTLLGGANNTRHASLHSAGAGRALDWSIGLDWHDTDGIPARTFSNTDRGYDNLSANVQATMSLARGSLTARHWQSTGNTEYEDFFGGSADQDYANSSTALEWRHDASERWQSTLTLSTIRDEIEQRSSPDFVESRRTAIDWQNTVSAGDAHTLVAGAYLSRERADVLSFGAGFTEDTDFHAVYLQDRIDLDPVSLSLAARYSDYDSFGSELTWNAEAGYRFNDRWRVGLTAGKAFRAPDATDRFGFGGNPDLAPEVSSQVRATVAWTPAGTHRVSFDVFRNDIDDLIEFDLTDFVLRNVARAEVRGAQLSWRWRPGDWDLRVDAVRQSADNAIDDSRLLRRAERSLSASVTRSIGAHAIALNVRADGERKDFGGVTMPGYVLASVSGRLQISPDWHVAARIENLLDTDYETASTFNTAGRQGFLQLGYSWR